MEDKTFYGPKKITDKYQIFNLWMDFGEAIGIQKLKDLYGEYWPRYPLDGEIVWAWYRICEHLLIEDETLIGWSSVRKDILDPVIWMNVGIFPSYQHLGISKIIIRTTVEMGFNAFPECEWLFVAVSRANIDHLQTRLRYQSKHKTKWVIAGEMFYPLPGYIIFGIRKELFFTPRKLEDDEFPEGSIDYPPEKEETIYDYIRNSI